MAQYFKTVPLVTCHIVLYFYMQQEQMFVFSQKNNSPLFSITGCVQTLAIIGPIFGFLLGSLCAKLYVDIGFVDLGKSENSDLNNSVRLQYTYFRHVF